MCGARNAHEDLVVRHRLEDAALNGNLRVPLQLEALANDLTPGKEFLKEFTRKLFTCIKLLNDIFVNRTQESAVGRRDR